MTTTKRRGLLVIFLCRFRARVDLPKKIHLGCGLSQRDEAAHGFLTKRISSFPRQKKIDRGCTFSKEGLVVIMVIMGWRMVMVIGG